MPEIVIVFSIVVSFFILYKILKTFKDEKEQKGKTHGPKKHNTF